MANGEVPSRAGVKIEAVEKSNLAAGRRLQVGQPTRPAVRPVAPYLSRPHLCI